MKTIILIASGSVALLGTGLYFRLRNQTERAIDRSRLRRKLTNGYQAIKAVPANLAGYARKLMHTEQPAVSIS